ncbi:MAG TPA: ROK family protein [Candidatus Gallibacteroides avistercoris]|uniref:ROK family protein n=1 Tax=Candidatus Gallibacteroides avistercoris TaxID=2840833 RepID=A0A9D1M8Z6_9BACT|nr:ROK family protein [Candidatus Gallibacteroides avistercoris]
MYETDPRTVLTLDAGGTNLIFSAIAGNRELVQPVHFHSVPDNLDKMLNTLVAGFETVQRQLATPPVAISFAFPGPADYAHGIIGDLPNFPSFRGGVALGPFLERKFGIPVFINNDGNLFAYGEALSGALPEINVLLEKAGSTKRYRNLLGLTLGTGFGAGAVIDNRLLTGDNGCGGDVWVFRNKQYGDMICEESVSIRAIRRVYGELTGSDASSLTPLDIFEIAEGKRQGDRQAACESFRQFGEVAGDVISQALTIIDGVVVLGGGLTGAAKYFMPALLKEMRSEIKTFAGDRFPRLQMQVFNLDSPEERADFVREKAISVTIPQSDVHTRYHHVRQTPVICSKLGASRAIALGAYAYAIAKLDRHC